MNLFQRVSQGYFLFSFSQNLQTCMLHARLRLRCQNMAQEPEKSGKRSVSRVCHSCSYHIWTSSVISYWTDARQHGIYLSYMIKKPRKIVHDVICASVRQLIVSKNQSKCENKLSDYICFCTVIFIYGSVVKIWSLYITTLMGGFN